MDNTMATTQSRVLRDIFSHTQTLIRTVSLMRMTSMTITTEFLMYGREIQILTEMGS